MNQLTVFGTDTKTSKSGLDVVKANFVAKEPMDFDQIFSENYSRIRILTYSSDLRILHKIISKYDKVEVIIGRPAMVKQYDEFFHYQTQLSKELSVCFKKSKDVIREKIINKKLHLFVCKDIVSHEKCYLLEGPSGARRVLSTSANFSTAAFSGRQNEGYIIFDNDEDAFLHYEENFVHIRDKSSIEFPNPIRLLEDDYTPDLKSDLSLDGVEISKGESAGEVEQKMFSFKRSKQLTETIPSPNKSKLVFRGPQLDRISKALQKPTKEKAPKSRSLSINIEDELMELNEQYTSLKTQDTEKVKNDLRLLDEFFQGYQHFSGQVDKIIRNYNAFLTWALAVPMACDFRAGGLEENPYLYDYPLVGVLYGNSTSGKSQFLKLIHKMVTGTTQGVQNGQFTKAGIAAMQLDFKRYPIMIDDLDSTRFSSHAVEVIKNTDLLVNGEYAPIMIAMNASQDAFNTEIWKRSFIRSTRASLPDNDDKTRTLGRKTAEIIQEMSSSFFQSYLYHMVRHFKGEQVTTYSPQENLDMLYVSHSIIKTHYEQFIGQVPDWLSRVDIREVNREKYSPVVSDLMQLVINDPKAWKVKRGEVVLSADPITVRRLKKNTPDYLINSAISGQISFQREEIESFLNYRFRSGLFGII